MAVHAALPLSQSPAQAEDAAQAALLRAWRSARRGDSVESPPAWVARIAQREALRLRAREKPQVDIDDIAAGEALATAGPDEEVAAKLGFERLVEYVPPADRALLRLRYGHDLTQERIAAVLDIPEGTVKVRLARLRVRLRAFA